MNNYTPAELYFLIPIGTIFAICTVIFFLFIVYSIIQTEILKFINKKNDIWQKKQ